MLIFKLRFGFIFFLKNKCGFIEDKSNQKQLMLTQSQTIHVIAQTFPRGCSAVCMYLSSFINKYLSPSNGLDPVLGSDWGEINPANH